MIKKIDFTKISDSSKVIELLKKSEEIEKEIREIDEMALVKYELQALNIDDENDVIVDKVKEL